MNRRRSSTNDMGRNHPYLRFIPETEWEKAKIKRGKDWVQVIQNNVITYDSRNKTS